MSQDDFFDDEDALEMAQAEAAAKRRRRTRTIALMALGGVSALSVYACMKAEEENRLAQQANGGAAGGNGQQAQTHYRPSYMPWLWMNRGFGGGTAPVPGATSGFNAGGGTATAGRSTVTPGGSTSTSTSRGGFGAFGRALSGLS